MLPDVQAAGEDEESQPFTQELPSLLTNAMPVAGVLHIFANAASQVDRALQWWPTLHSKLKVMESFICRFDKSQQFIAKCLVDTVWAEHAGLFRKKHMGLYDKRWQEVHEFCLIVHEILECGALQNCWDNEKMQKSKRRGEGDGQAADHDGDDGDENQFDEKAVSSVAGDIFFCAYVHMII